ncbi:MAG: hypothetical protein QG632_243 [Candidatus Dependentiae bacterium]|nr:hypothetical protein [Candidatus Dependentiae bacterium]
MSSSFMPSSGSISSPQYFVPIRISAEPLRAELGLMEAVVNPLDSHTTSESPE